MARSSLGTPVTHTFLGVDLMDSKWKVVVAGPQALALDQNARPGGAAVQAHAAPDPSSTFAPCSNRPDHGTESAVRLTSREMDVLQALAHGYTYVQTGEWLGMSVNTVASHVKNLYRKLEVHSGRAAVRRAFELCLLGDGEGAFPRLSGLDTE